eukprot:552951_1
MCHQGKKPKAYNNINNNAFPPQQHKQTHSWKCSKCTFVNDKINALCKMCSNPQSSTITIKSNSKKKNQPNNVQNSHYDNDEDSDDEWEVCDIVHTTKAVKTEDVDKLAQQIQAQLSLKHTHDKQQLLSLEQKMKQQKKMSEQQLATIQQKLSEITLTQQQQKEQQNEFDKQRKYLEKKQKQTQLQQLQNIQLLSHNQMLTQKQTMHILKDDEKHNENIENQKNNVIQQNILDTMDNDIDGVDINDMNGPTKQFYLFLKDHRLEKYFSKFEENSCCDIRDIEYLVNDENFLQKDIGMKNTIERQRFLGESRKLKHNMDLFKNANISSILLVKLSKFGVVTFDILCNEIESKLDLKNKFKIYNDNQCDLLWSSINSHLNPQKNYNQQQYQQEGVSKNMKETDYI